MGIEAEKTFELQNDLGVVLNYDSLGRIMINESRQSESDLHINQSGAGHLGFKIKYWTLETECKTPYMLDT